MLKMYYIIQNMLPLFKRAISESLIIITEFRYNTGLNQFHILGSFGQQWLGQLEVHLSCLGANNDNK